MRAKQRPGTSPAPRCRCTLRGAHFHASPQIEGGLSTDQVTAQLENALWRNRHDGSQRLAALVGHDAVVASSDFSPHCPGGIAGSDTESPSALMSRDIELTTTMDITARGLASDATSSSAPTTIRPPSTTFFLANVDCPGITPFDPVNWLVAKRRFVELAATSPAAAEAIAAVCAVHRSQLYGVLVPGAKPLYDSARVLLRDFCSRMQDTQVLAAKTGHRHECFLVASFLLTLAELVHNDEPYDADGGPVLKADDDIAMSSEAWLNTRSGFFPVLTPLSARLIAWLRIVHRITLRGGGAGLISDRVYDTLCRLQGDDNIQFPGGEPAAYDDPQEASAFPLDQARDSSIHPPDPQQLPPHHRQRPRSPVPIPNIVTDSETSAEDMLYLALAGPLFTFYYRLQLLSGYIARLTHYHRSRVTSDDQDVVFVRLAAVRESLHALWSVTGTGDVGRMVVAGGLDAEALMGGERGKLVSDGVAQRLVNVMRLCEAAYHAEIVELDRVQGDPVQRYSAESRASVRAIRRLVDAALDAASCAGDDWQQGANSSGQTSQDVGRPSEESSHGWQVPRQSVAWSGPRQTSCSCFGTTTTLDPGFLRPLFLCAIETIDERSGPTGRCR